MDDDEKGKLFVGGLSWETSQDKLQDYFSQFGEIIDCVVMKNSESGRSRGFGFVTFSDPSIVALVLQTRPHQLDGRTIDPKPCNPRTLQKPKRGGYPKLFLGGLPSNVTETDLRTFFTRFGKVAEVVIMFDQKKQKSRGFGFLSFENEESVERCVNEHYVYLNGKKVEIKRAQPRDGFEESKSSDEEDVNVPVGKRQKMLESARMHQCNGMHQNGNSNQGYDNWRFNSSRSPKAMKSKETEEELNHSTVNWNSWNMPQYFSPTGPFGDASTTNRYVMCPSQFKVMNANANPIVPGSYPNIGYYQEYLTNDKLRVPGQMQYVFPNAYTHPQLGTYAPEQAMMPTFMSPFCTNILLKRKPDELSPAGGDAVFTKSCQQSNKVNPMNQSSFHQYNH